MTYKPLDDKTRANCVILLRQALQLADQANELLGVAGQAVNGVLQALNAKDEGNADGKNTN